MNINATLISQALIFAVFVYICYRYIWPPILSTMEERENKMAAGLEAAKQAGALIDPSEVAEAVLFILSRPRNVTIHDIVVLPTNIDA